MLRAILHPRRSPHAVLVLGCVCAGLMVPSTSFANSVHTATPSMPNSGAPSTSNSGAPAAPNSGAPSAPDTGAPSTSNTGAPSISGIAQQGQRLTANHGTWTGYYSSYSNRWVRCNSSGSACVSIPSATGSSYVPVAEDVGHRLRVEETASQSFNHPSTAVSAPTAVVIPPIPANTSLPTITGMTQQGQPLTERNGSWTNSPTGRTYRWLRCNTLGSGCVAISSATAQTYALVAADDGHTLRVQETASNVAGSSSPAESAASAVILASIAEQTASPTTLQSNSLIPPSRVVISARSVTISKHGSAPITVSCPASAVNGCVGSITIRLVQTSSKRTMVVASRCARGCRPIGSAKYEARAGKRITVHVHIASYARKQLSGRKKLEVTLTALTFSDGQTATSVRTILLRERKHDHER